MLTLFLFIVSALCVFCRACTRGYAQNTVGFLHASAGAGGGGERVLWVALDGLQRSDMAKKVERQYVVFTQEYTPNDPTPTESSDEYLLSLVETQFNVRLARPVTFVYLRKGFTKWLSGDVYPHFTLLLQTLYGGAALFFESAVMNSMTPTVVETVGVPFVYPLLRLLAGCTVISYTHYPIISSAMTQRVRNGEAGHNNAGFIAHNPALRWGKLAYYKVVYLLYRCMGWFPHVVFTNSSWTQNHVQAAFWPRTCIRLFPPCDTAGFAAASKPAVERRPSIVSVGQFRPEKNHCLQLGAFHQALPHLPADARLVVIGGARNVADEERVAALRTHAKKLGIEGRVELRVNAAVNEVREALGSCVIGLHTMVDEHFGIVLLEYMAAGCIPLGHRSGGVQLDIVNSADLGFLACTQDEYAEAMAKIFDMHQHHPDEFERFQQRCREHVSSFDDATFRERFVALLNTYFYAA
ncbi:putative alpha-12-mannosyltransferase [Leptomonas pyrrhocoris]|uniref:GDP-Man:Man(3)GlcNAc(2)-PP-Dol alpha-1,2-mannosyltransferase n=1 Tax=Leptomonas pyrrhocoris TaxID=157538 RepID=A0A0M9GB46_LEPPY|nr:putative alpha-12-mannosyltransferase [Leptomonas pyrrhocoris]XP_015665106.1 putative alpha-12-mannosyltransferase [Leptomonas pyrrhocoris]KPA86666.1 putative alpha-12-mannosyltransferase [Leptomonas pyrrhocoris]KPA86667.1 putative alpha-12-mannosyltransferase [Leptomonas pyrrhocoris]|eukprot:XP_015665105.1 putative alpha-12-mannosyltransferase [Leptomonas pyrrhocoris]